MRDKPKNKATVYWEQSSYSVINTSELNPLPTEIKRMLLDHLLYELKIPLRTTTTKEEQ